MPLKHILSVILLAPMLVLSQEEKTFTTQYREDFNFFWESINTDYCYFNKKQTDWEKVKAIYLPQTDTLKTRPQFVSLLENAFYEIYDHHASLNTNTPNSQRLVPSGTDIWAEFINGKPIIAEVRKNFGAEKCGIVPGMEVITVNDIPVMKAIEPFFAKSLKATDEEAKNYALRSLLAGNHITPRKITLKINNKTADYFPDSPSPLLENINYATKIESRMINNTGYIKINNCLFDNDLLPLFDSIMLTLQQTNALILDLRETPSGGNTTVARAILSWFIRQDHYYQKHELYAEEKQTGIKRSWMEIVSPRPGKYYSKPVVVLVDHWTGSIAEGITIAFDGMKRATVLGTTMARLNGAVYSYEMPNTKIHFSFPVERLYHVNGTSREKYIPPVYIDLIKQPYKPGEDIFLDIAIKYLKKKQQ
ncbi:MAG: peptidase [Bacteroidota bacterium]|nr:peptidase [Bacteroidota bacterium]